MIVFFFQAMKQTRRHKFFQISVFFLIYSIIHVVSTNRETPIESDNLGGENHEEVTSTVKTLNEKDTIPHRQEPQPTSTTQKPTKKTTHQPKAETTTERSSTTTSTSHHVAAVPPNEKVRETPTSGTHPTKNTRSGAKTAAGVAAGAAAGSAAVAAVQHTLNKTSTASTNVENKKEHTTKGTVNSFPEVTNSTTNESLCTPAAIKQVSLFK